MALSNLEHYWNTEEPYDLLVCSEEWKLQYNELVPLMQLSGPTHTYPHEHPRILRVFSKDHHETGTTTKVIQNWLHWGSPYIRAKRENLVREEIDEPYWTFQTDRWEQQFIDPHSEELHNLVRQISGGQKLVHIGGRKQNLRDTLALMKYAQGHIGTDSGMMHLAMTIMEPHQVHCIHTGKQRWLGHVKQFKVKGGNLYVI